MIYVYFIFKIIGFVLLSIIILLPIFDFLGLLLFCIILSLIASYTIVSYKVVLCPWILWLIYLFLKEHLNEHYRRLSQEEVDVLCFQYKSDNKMVKF